MSDSAFRQQRTVPLDEGEASVPDEMDSLDSSARTGFPPQSPSAPGKQRRRRRKSDSAVRKRNGTIQSRSGHNSPSTATSPSLSLDDITKEIVEKRGSSSWVGAKTPVSGSHAVMIGSALSSSRNLVFTPLTPTSNSPRRTTTQAQFSSLPNLLSLEQALRDCAEQDIEKIVQECGGKERNNNLTRTPVIWKTPFEVDAPRETPMPRRPSLSSSVASESEPNFSEEQDAWAGIDELLDAKSLDDDSFCYSTTDILPAATVKAMRRQRSFQSTGESIAPEDMESENTGSRRRSLDSISNSASYSHSNRGRGHERRKSEPSEFLVTPKARSVDYTKPTNELWRDVKDRNARHSPQELEPMATPGGTLFDMFHWSEKANVDEERGRKKKLNRRPRKTTFIMADSSHGSETGSMPSLATIKADDVRKNLSSLEPDSMHAAGSVVTENSSDEVSFFQSSGDSGEGDDSVHTPISNTASTLADDGLVLDKGVDEYIRQMQQKLPTIDENAGSPIKTGRKKKSVAFMDIHSPSPTTVVEESPLDELPSLTSLSGGGLGSGANTTAATKNANDRPEQKKEPKQSLSLQLKNRLKKMKSKVKASRLGLANGNEEKYFPDAALAPEKSKGFSAKRCLLSGGDDGVNWD